jgi:hypothetical protein
MLLLIELDSFKVYMTNFEDTLGITVRDGKTCSHLGQMVGEDEDCAQPALYFVRC